MICEINLLATDLRLVIYIKKFNLVLSLIIALKISETSYFLIIANKKNVNFIKIN